jgi:hypothetical protein
MTDNRDTQDSRELQVNPVNSPTHLHKLDHLAHQDHLGNRTPISLKFICKRDNFTLFYSGGDGHPGQPGTDGKPGDQGPPGDGY